MRAFVLSLVALLAPAAAARAATYNVTSTGDSGSGTLRAALAQATTGDTITFSTAGPITLSSSALAVDQGVDIDGCSDANAAAPCVTLSVTGGFDALDVTGAGATVTGIDIIGAAIGIHVSASDVTVGGFSPSTENEIDDSAGPAIEVDGAAGGVVIDRNIGHGNGGPFVQLAPGADGAVQPPTILAASGREVSGMAVPGALVTVFAAPGPGSVTSFDGAVTADQTGLWELPGSANQGELVAAAQTGTSGTSALSASTSAGGSTAAGPPTATITGPSGTIYTASPVFTLVSSDPGAMLLCRLDGAPYSVCGASYSRSALPEGQHTLIARAVDGNGIGPEVSSAFNVDLAQAGTVVSGPPRYGRKSFARFSFTVAPGTAATVCGLDDQRLEPCHGRFSTGYILDGRHVFHLQTTDAAGEAVVVDTVFTVDTLAPAITIASAQTHLSSNRTVTFTIACPPSEPGGCTGTVALSTVPARRSHRTRAVGSASWHAGPSTTEAVAIAVPLWAVSAALQGRGLAVQAVITGRDDAGNVTVLRRKAVIVVSANAVWRRKPRHTR